MDANEMIRQFCNRAAFLAEENNIPELEKALAVFPTLFECRIPPEVTGWDSGTVLHQCCSNKKVEPATLKFILEHGGRTVVNTPDTNGHTPVFRAKRYYVIRYNGEPADRDRRQEIINILKQYGADDSLPALQNKTDLHFAVMRLPGHGPIDMAVMRARLQQHPEEVFMRDVHGNTPLDYIADKPRPNGTTKHGGHQPQDIFRAFLEPSLALCHPEHGVWLANQKWIYHTLAEDDFLADIFRYDRWRGHEEAGLLLRDDMARYFATPSAASEWPVPEWLRALSREKLAAIDFSAFEREAGARANAAQGDKFQQVLKRSQKSGGPSAPGNSIV